MIFINFKHIHVNLKIKQTINITKIYLICCQVIQCCRSAKQLIFTRECFDVVRGSIIIDFNVKISTFGESYSNFRGVVNSFPQVKIGKF